MDQPWSGRKLHFVGIGGVGMSGLAKVGPQPRRRGRPRARDRGRWHRPRGRATSRPAPRSSTRARSRRTTPSARPARPSCTAPTCSASSRSSSRRSPSPAPTARRRRRDDRPRAARGRRATWSAARSARTGTNADWEPTASGWSSRPTSPTAACSSCTRRSRSSPTPSSTTTPTYASQRDVDDTFRAFLARASGRRSCAPDLTPAARRTRHVFGEYDGAARRCPGAHNARNAARRAESDRARRGRRAGRGGRLADFEGAGRRFETSGTGQRRAGRRRLRPPPDRGPRHDRGRAHAGRRAASSRSSSRTCTQRTQREAKAFGAALAQADLAVRARRLSRARAPEDYPGVTGLLVAQATADAGRRQARGLGATHATARRLPASGVAGRRPAAHDGRRRREHDRQGPRRATAEPTRHDDAACKVGLAARRRHRADARGGWICGCATPASSRSSDVADHRRDRVRRRAGRGRAREARARDMTTLHVARADACATRPRRTARSTTCRSRPTSRTRSDPRDRAPAGRRAAPARRPRGSRSPATASCCAASTAERDLPSVELDATRPVGARGHRPQAAARARRRGRRARRRCCGRTTSSRSTSAASSSTLDERPRTGVRRRRGRATRSGPRRPASWPRSRPREPPISTSGFPGGWPQEALRRSLTTDARPEPST